jgi:hypothetical protein
VRSGAPPGLEVAHRFVQQGLVHLGAENGVGQLELADLLVVEIHNID